MKPAPIESSNGGGLRAVSPSTTTLPDLCHHAEYRIYVDSQYVESEGNLGPNAQRVLEFYQRRRRGKPVEVRVLACKVPGCTWGQL
jgi:hypothetical protein